MTYILIGAALAASIIDWIAVAREWKTVEYVFKPGVIVILLIWIWQVSGFQGRMVWFGIGLLFSLIGDIFIMMPKNYLYGGLISFLLALIAYSVGINTMPPALDLASLVLGIFVLLPSIQVYRRLIESLNASGNSKMIMPVSIYGIAISLLLYSALLTLASPDWPFGSAIPISAGGLLFYLSDVYLGWNKYISSLRFGKLQVIVPYHLGQILITVGAAIQFAG